MPTIWKKSYVCPVHKKSGIDNIQNYRPISLLCNFAKIFETTLFQHIYEEFKRTISPFQHGFMQKRCQYVAEAIDKKTQVDVIYIYRFP